MSRLKPCPLCGGEAVWQSGSILCPECSLSMPWASTVEDTEDRWNRRALLDGLATGAALQEEDKIESGLLRCAGDHCDDRCPYNDINYGCRPRLMLDAVELLRRQDQEIADLRKKIRSLEAGSPATDLGSEPCE